MCVFCNALYLLVLIVTVASKPLLRSIKIHGSFCNKLKECLNQLFEPVREVLLVDRLSPIEFAALVLPCILTLIQVVLCCENILVL